MDPASKTSSLKVLEAVIGFKKFTTSQLHQKLGVTEPREKRKVRKYVQRLCQKGLIRVARALFWANREIGETSW